MPRTIPIDADASDGVDHLSNVFAVESNAPLIWLGDIIAEPDWLPLTNVVSIGDLLLSLGLPRGSSSLHSTDARSVALLAEPGLQGPPG